jgi:hypothetical protein
MKVNNLIEQNQICFSYTLFCFSFEELGEKINFFLLDFCSIFVRFLAYSESFLVIFFNDYAILTISAKSSRRISTLRHSFRQKIVSDGHRSFHRFSSRQQLFQTNKLLIRQISKKIQLNNCIILWSPKLYLPKYVKSLEINVVLIILSHLIVVDINLSRMNDAEMISYEMIICRNECRRVEICRDDFAELKITLFNVSNIAH